DGSTFIIKYDINGGFIWAKKEDFVGEGYSLTIDNSDNVILTGTFIDTISIGSAVLQSAGSEDCFIVKYNSSSAFQWAKRAGGEYVEYTSLVSTDANDNIYISGEYVSETVTIGSYSFPMLAGEGNVLLAKLNPNGGVIWAKSFGDIDDATNWWDEVTWPTGIITDDNGNTYIKGNLSYEGKFDNIKLENSDSYFNKFIAKIDSSGTTLWAKGIYQPVQSHNFDYNQFDIDDEGNVYFGMQAKTILNFGTAYQYSPTSNSDLFIAKYSTIGDLEWVKTMEGIDYGYTWISSVAVYDTANVFVAGFFRNQLAIDGAIMNSNIYHGFISMLGPNIITGFKDIYNNNSSKIEIFPNPTSDNISFVTDKNITNAIINIYSINGALIKTQTINSNAVNVSKLSKGIYIVKITSEKGKVYLSKFVKN
ncbi:MAG: T9SS type A sorting domain-containing protein, partial [Bacteroidales bacterium]|nr:T9SS type A sorting domain-containing protein [Bacteroidales bacterium]